MSKREDLLHGIYRDFAAPLRTYIDLNFPSIRQDREDTIQEILEKIVRRIYSYDSRYALSTWIYTIARNHCLDLIRRQKSAPVSIQDGLDAQESPDRGPHDLAAANMDRQRIRILLSRLPGDVRQILFLLYYDGMPYREAARVMNKPVGTVKYLAHKARKWMKENWEVPL